MMPHAHIAGFGGNVAGAIPIGTYVVGGAGMKANVGSGGGSFLSTTPTFSGGTYDIIDAVWNPTYSNFVLLGNPTSGAQDAAKAILTSTDGVSFASPSGSGDSTIPATQPKNRLHLWSNGNIGTNYCASGNALSTNGAASFTSQNAIGNGGYATGWIGSGNNGCICGDFSSGSYFAYTTTGYSTYTNSQTHTVLLGITTSLFLNGNYIFGSGGTSLAYGTTASQTALTTITGNLGSTLLGGVWDGTGYCIFGATSLSTASTIGGTYTSRTTAFFTTAGMTGNISAMATDGAGNIIAGTDTGDVAISTDHGVTWTKLSGTANPLSGGVIKGIQYLLSNFWIYGSVSTNGAVAFSATGTAFTNLPLAGFTGNAVLALAGH